MEPVYLLFYIFVIFGHTIPKIEAGLLDPITNFLNPISNQPVEPDQMLTQFIPQYQGNIQPANNADFNPSNTRMPNSNSKILFKDPNVSRLSFSNQINSRLPPEDPSNSRITFEDANSSRLPLDNPTNTILLATSDSGSLRLPPEDSSNSVIHNNDGTTSGLPSNNPSNSRSPSINPNNSILSLEDPNTSRTTYGDPNQINEAFNTKKNNGITPSLLGYTQRWPAGSNQYQMQEILADLSKKTTKSTTSDYDKIIAERFPEAVNLLDKLKKLNKLKQQRQQEQQKNQTGEKKTTTTTVSYDKDAIAELLKPLEGVDDKSTTAANQMRVVMKKLKKTRFYYRAQPVTPENEKNHTKETVYYIDL